MSSIKPNTDIIKSLGFTPRGQLETILEIFDNNTNEIIKAQKRFIDNSFPSTAIETLPLWEKYLKLPPIEAKKDDLEYRQNRASIAYKEIDSSSPHELEKLLRDSGLDVYVYELSKGENPINNQIVNYPVRIGENTKLSQNTTMGQPRVELLANGQMMAVYKNYESKLGKQSKLGDNAKMGDYSGTYEIIKKDHWYLDEKYWHFYYAIGGKKNTDGSINYAKLHSWEIEELKRLILKHQTKGLWAMLLLED